MNANNYLENSTIRKITEDVIFGRKDKGKLTEMINYLYGLPVMESRRMAHRIVEAFSEKKLNIRSVWDNGGKSTDRYTIVFNTKSGQFFEALGVSEDPDRFSQWSEASEGRHLGKKIKFADLPMEVQKHVAERVNESVKRNAGLNEARQVMTVYTQSKGSPEAINQNRELGVKGNFTVKEYLKYLKDEEHIEIKKIGGNTYQLTDEDGKKFIEYIWQEKMSESVGRSSNLHEATEDDIHSVWKQKERVFKHPTFIVAFNKKENEPRHKAIGVFFRDDGSIMVNEFTVPDPFKEFQQKRGAKSIQFRALPKELKAEVKKYRI